jgi:hypothetical protein
MNMEKAVIKEICIDIFVLVFTALLFWMLVSTDILVNNFFILLVTVLAVPVWIAVLAVALGMVSNKSAVLLILLVPVILVLFGFNEIAIIVAALLIAALMFAARLSIIGDHKSRKKYKTRYVFYPGTKLLVMATIILITGISMSDITKSLQSEDELIPESSVNLLLKPYEPFLVKNIPGGSLDASIGETIDIQLQEQYADNPAQLEMQREMIHKELTDQLSDQFNQEISTEDNISTVVTRVLNEKIHSITNDYPAFTPVVIFAIVILVARIFIPVISIVLLLLIAFIILVSRKSNLIKLLDVSEPVEHLEL